MKRVWNAQDWTYDEARRTVNSGEFNYSLILQFLAVKITIQGHHLVPSTTRSNKHPLEESGKRCVQELHALFPGKTSFFGRNIFAILCSRFRIDHTFFDEVSHNFQSIVIELDEFVTGDENVVHFIGKYSFCSQQAY